VEAVLIVPSYVLAGIRVRQHGAGAGLGTRLAADLNRFPRQPGLTPTRRPHELCCSSSPEIPSGTAAADPAHAGRRHRDPVRARDGWLNSAARCRYMHCRAEVR
jgi:hypothetical protein